MEAPLKRGCARLYRRVALAYILILCSPWVAPSSTPSILFPASGIGLTARMFHARESYQKTWLPASAPHACNRAIVLG